MLELCTVFGGQRVRTSIDKRLRVCYLILYIVYVASGAKGIYRNNFNNDPPFLASAAAEHSNETP